MRPTAHTANPIGTFTNITQRHDTSCGQGASGHQADGSPGR